MSVKAEGSDVDFILFAVLDDGCDDDDEEIDDEIEGEEGEGGGLGEG